MNEPYFGVKYGDFQLKESWWNEFPIITRYSKIKKKKKWMRIVCFHLYKIEVLVFFYFADKSTIVQLNAN